MNSVIADPGSFRDPGGRVFTDGHRIIRAVYSPNAKAYASFRDSGLLQKLVDRDMLVESIEIDPSSVGMDGERAAFLLEHPRIPFISYPYEWNATLLRKAALLHLDIQLLALESGFTLSDATAYNIQFIGSRPIFIDHLSFRPYQPDEVWAGHRQFCMQFLNPLILWDRLGVAPNSWFRGSQEGIAPEDLAPLLRARDRLSFTIMSHVIAQAAMQRRSIQNEGQGRDQRRGRLSKQGFRAMLSGLRDFIAAAGKGSSTTVWSSYACDNSYGETEASVKRDFVQGMVAAVAPAILFDIGCNSGDYSIAALEAGARSVVGFDFDFGALDVACSRAETGKLDFLPLWLDAANPSPSQGWGQAERPGLKERANADAIVALAFIHHIAIGKNVPLEMAVNWMIDMAPNGVIEFPPKSDPMVQRLLSNREDIFPNYNEAAFRSAVEQRGRIVSEKHLTPNGRLLIHYERTP